MRPPPPTGYGLAALLTAAALAAAGCAGDENASPDGNHSAATPSAPEGGGAAASPTPAQRSFSVVATGDVLPHERVLTQARRDASAPREHDFRSLLAGVRPAVRGADLAICHMETPFAPQGGPYEGFPTFASPPQLADALAWLGYDACSTASNHTLDQGYSGVVRTLETLEGAGIAPYGASRSTQEARRPEIITVEGVKVGLLAYTFSFNGTPEPEGKPWVADRIDPAEILSDAEAAKRSGAEVVLVSLHWGTEYQHEITERQRELAPRLLDSPDIDLLIGHHAHVAQPIERIDGEWVAYGLGNHVAAHETPVPANHEGVLARFTFAEDAGGWSVRRAEYLSTYVSPPYPVRLLGVPAALRSPDSVPESRERLEKALSRTHRVVNSRGGADDGLVPITPD